MGLPPRTQPGLPSRSPPSPAGTPPLRCRPARGELPGGAPSPSRTLGGEVPPWSDPRRSLPAPTPPRWRSPGRGGQAHAHKDPPFSLPLRSPHRTAAKVPSTCPDPTSQGGTEPDPSPRPQTAGTRHLLSPLTQAIPTLWPPTASASVPPRGQEALLPNRTASGPRTGFPLGSRTPLTPAGRHRAEDGAG